MHNLEVAGASPAPATSKKQNAPRGRFALRQQGNGLLVCEAGENKLCERDRGECREREQELFPVKRDDKHPKSVREIPQCNEPQGGIYPKEGIPEALLHTLHYTIQY